MSVDELKIKNQKSDSAQDDSRNNANLSLKKWNFDLEKKEDLRLFAEILPARATSF